MIFYRVAVNNSVPVLIMYSRGRKELKGIAKREKVSVWQQYETKSKERRKATCTKKKLSLDRVEKNNCYLHVKSIEPSIKMKHLEILFCLKINNKLHGKERKLCSRGDCRREVKTFLHISTMGGNENENPQDFL